MVYNADINQNSFDAESINNWKKESMRFQGESRKIKENWNAITTRCFQLSHRESRDIRILYAKYSTFCIYCIIIILSSSNRCAVQLFSLFHITYVKKICKDMNIIINYCARNIFNVPTCYNLYDDRRYNYKY